MTGFAYDMYGLVDNPNAYSRFCDSNFYTRLAKLIIRHLPSTVRVIFVTVPIYCVERTHITPEDVLRLAVGYVAAQFGIAYKSTHMTNSIHLDGVVVVAVDLATLNKALWQYRDLPAGLWERCVKLS